MINSFKGKNRFLSNFYASRIEFRFPIFPPSFHVVSPVLAVANTVEHGYQASKSVHLDEAFAILTISTPGKAKRGGRNCVMRSDWEDVKLSVMHSLVWNKFKTHEDLRQLLLDTDGHELVEGNTWGDTFWGVCNGVGENHLGKILMDVRDLFQYSDYVDELVDRVVPIGNNS